MKILLDTHIYLWCLEDTHLSEDLRTVINSADEVYVSSISIWEIAIKTNLGKLKANVNELATNITKSGFLELPFTAKHAAYLYKLPNHHRDPFDRALIAQATCEPLRLLSIDSQLQKYSNLVDIIY